MAQVLELSDRKLKKKTMNNLRVPGEKEDSMQVQMGYVRREMETLRKNQKKTSEIKKTLEEKF